MPRSGSARASCGRWPPRASRPGWPGIRGARCAASAGWAVSWSRVAAGRSDCGPAKGDRRFADPAWEGNWAFHRLMQAYLSIGETVSGLVTDSDVDWRAERQARFAASNILDALAPTNFPWSNPAVIKATIDEGGANLVRGARHFASDVSRPPRLPAMVDTSKFAVGENLAITPGSVVLRTEVFELIHYTPRTEQVHEVPLLFVPPTINKYYILDLAPGRSMVEHMLASGLQVFMMSWRNPDEAQGHFDFDTYARAVLEARDAVAAIAGQETVHLNAACSGGIITAGLLGQLAASGDLGAVASLTLLVCALDNERSGTASAFTNRELAAVAVAESARKGYVDGQALAGVFAWLRPNDLVWGYVVNNYLLGKAPPAFDILYWNQDTVRLAAGLHRDFMLLSLENSLARPGALEVFGTPVDLGRGRHRQLRRRRPQRPHHPVGERLPQRRAAGRHHAVRALHQRAHPGADQPAEREEPRELPRRRGAPGGHAGLPRAGPDRARQLVAGLRAMAARALRRAQARAGQARRPQAQGAGQGAGQLRPRELRRA